MKIYLCMKNELKQTVSNQRNFDKNATVISSIASFSRKPKVMFDHSTQEHNQILFKGGGRKMGGSYRNVFMERNIIWTVNT